MAGVARSVATFTGVGAAIGGIAASIGGIGKGFKLAADMEQTKVAFTTMLKSGERAQALMKELSSFAASTPFEFPELATAAKSLVAFGVEAENVQPALRAIGDIAAGIGAPIGEIAELYGKAKVQGRLFAEDINQLTGRGIPIIQELAKQFKVNDSAIKKMVESGQVNFTHLEKAFKSLTSAGGTFENMMEAQSKTLAGMWSTLKDEIGTSLRGIAEILISELNVKDGMKQLSEWIKEFTKSASVAILTTIGWVKQNSEVIISFAKWTAGIIATVAAIKTLVTIARTVIATYKAIAAAQSAVLALSGPAGWAMLAGAVIATGIALAAVDKTFEKIADSAKDLNEQMNRSIDLSSQLQSATLAQLHQQYKQLQDQLSSEVNQAVDPKKIGYTMSDLDRVRQKIKEVTEAQAALGEQMMADARRNSTSALGKQMMADASKVPAPSTGITDQMKKQKEWQQKFQSMMQDLSMDKLKLSGWEPEQIRYLEIMQDMIQTTGTLNKDHLLMIRSGLTDAMRARKKAEADEKKAQKKEEDKNKYQGLADSIKESIKTPVDILNDQIKQAHHLFHKGFLTQQQRDKAIAKAQKDYKDALPPPEKAELALGTNIAAKSAEAMALKHAVIAPSSKIDDASANEATVEIPKVIKEAATEQRESDKSMLSTMKKVAQLIEKLLKDYKVVEVKELNWT